jgi:hypothetical protein
MGVVSLGDAEKAYAQTVARVTTAIERLPGLDGFALSAAIGHATCAPTKMYPILCVRPTLLCTRLLWLPSPP